MKRTVWALFEDSFLVFDPPGWEGEFIFDLIPQMCASSSTIARCLRKENLVDSVHGSETPLNGLVFR